MEKKISFGFFKQLKKPNIKPVEPEEKKQFIDCLEGNSIKVLGGEVVDEIKPLVIPLREKDKTTTASVLAQIARGQLDLQAEETEGAGSTPVIVEAPAVPIQNESLDKMAEREILEDLKKDAIKTSNNSNLVVPVADTLKLTGEKESTLEDYENIPVGDFGMAMLRGMGWQPGTGMGKHSKSSELILPNLRPKGMGLGADKVSSSSKSTETSIGKEELKLEKGAYVKIIKGKQNGTYGQISGFDEDSGRLIVKAAIGGSNIDINEHMVEAISKNEYQKMSKVINSAKYEEYKNRELKITSQEKHKEPDSDKKIYSSRPKSPRRSPEEYSSHRENKSHQKTHEEQVSSSRPSHTRDSRRDKYHRSPSRSSSSSPPRERDTEKKRKGKKKRRDKSRSRERRRH